MRLIEADALEKELRIGISNICFSTDAGIIKYVGAGTYGKSFISGVEKSIEKIKKAPTIDAVPVVRCGECKHCEVVETLIGPDTCCVNQGEMLVHKDIDDYCSWGERRADLNGGKKNDRT